ncbi:MULTISPECIES: EAL domain-containing protein [unclassified Devosia]|uniref:EAL domain-containing protein n=1 Tax=unclassified Devosia TaxID=196773 RepID=UPI001555270B
MFTPAHKSMPALDYVSTVKSVYKDRRAMIYGTLASAVGAATTALKTGSPLLWGITVIFLLIAVFRFIDMTQFKQADIGPEDVDAAYQWEVRATLWGAFAALVYGSWCFFSFVFVDDPVAEIISMVTTTGCMVGIVTRNFGLDRLLTLQLVIACTLMCAGLLLGGDIYHQVLGVLMLPMLLSMRVLARDVRLILLSAVHQRVEASRLAIELDTALDTMQHGLCMLDSRGFISVTNDYAEKIFQALVPGEWGGRCFSDSIAQAEAHDTLSHPDAQNLLDCVARGSGKTVLKLETGEFIEVTVSSRREQKVLLFENITARVEAAERINFMAHFDSLTGLPNRGHFAELVEADLVQRRTTRAFGEIVLMIVDIDDFKHVNDTMGHLIGDRLLVEVSHRLDTLMGVDCLVGRFGGDEFLVYRGDVTQAEAARDAEAIVAVFKPPFNIMGQVIAVNVSVGLVVEDAMAEGLDSLMTKADLALYKAKGSGKSQVQCFQEEMDVDYRYRQRLKTDLRHALDTDALSLVFQPIVDIQTQRVVSCEALARWHHPELGPISPAIFIPMAEETGLISDISRWVLTTATRECRSWPEDVSVSVNISARDFRNADVGDMVEEALRSSGLAPHRLEVEVTETALIEERDAATKILSGLATKGIGIALDDFGTGYSSLSYLQALPFTKLKIDRSFVMNIAADARALKLLSNVAQLGKDNNLVITAEGVETEDQLELVSQHTCVDQIQGFLFGAPLPRREIAELIGRMRMAQSFPAKIVKTVNSR